MALLPLAGVSRLAWVASLALVVVGALVGYAWPVEPGLAARRADRHGGLNAVCDTALHLEATGHPAAEPVALDALDGLRHLAPPPLTRPIGLPAVALGALLGLVLVGALRALEPEPEPVAQPGDEMLDELDTIEAEARRKGQVELVAAVQELRARVEAVQAASTAQPSEPLERHGPEPPAGPPTPPPPEPEEEEQLPPEFNSQAAYDEALEQAREGMLVDDQLAAEFASEIESRLMAVTELEQMGNDLLGATLQGAELSRSADFGGFDGTAPIGQQRSMNQANQALPEQFAQNTVDPASMANMQDVEDSFSQSHELAQGLQKTYQDFLEAYADALRDEPVEALEEVAERKSGKEGSSSLDNTGSGGFESREMSDSRTEQYKSDGTKNANFSPREEEGGPTGNLQMAQLGGQGKRMEGGGGAGGPSGDPNEGVGELGQAGGDLEQLQGGFGPGNLSDEQRQQVLQAVEGKAVQTGPGSDFDEAWTGYFDEVDRALVEEDMPPLMQNMVAAYFAGLKEER